ncbi:hypothetical protein LIA77_06313 [Sarocladium implicatum]|nr:hypothetical protein LIA77_06313 [Sarocladium implicatum]
MLPPRNNCQSIPAVFSVSGFPRKRLAVPCSSKLQILPRQLTPAKRAYPSIQVVVGIDTSDHYGSGATSWPVDQHPPSRPFKNLECCSRRQMQMESIRFDGSQSVRSR